MFYASGHLCKFTLGGGDYEEEEVSSKDYRTPRTTYIPWGSSTFVMEHHPLLAGTYHIPDCVHRSASVGQSFVETYPELVDNRSTRWRPSPATCWYRKATSQTHWHLDFTGSSVFYTVLSGKKDFLRTSSRQRRTCYLLSEYSHRLTLARQ